MDLFGRSTLIGNLGQQPYQQIPEFWQTCIADGTVDRIRAAASLQTNGQIHAVLYDKNETQLSYLIGYMLPPSGVSDGFDQLSVPPQTYAIFSTGEYPEFEMTYVRPRQRYVRDGNLDSHRPKNK